MSSAYKFFDVYPSSFTDLLGHLSFATLNIKFTAGTQCFEREVQPFYLDLLVSTTAPLILCGLLLVLPKLYVLYLQIFDSHESALAAKRGHLFNHTFHAVVILLYCLLPVTSEKLFTAFGCEDFGEEVGSRLIVDLSIKCDSDLHGYWIAYASVMIVIWPIGMQMWLGSILYRKRALLYGKERIDFDDNEALKPDLNGAQNIETMDEDAVRDNRRSTRVTFADGGSLGNKQTGISFDASGSPQGGGMEMVSRRSRAATSFHARPSVNPLRDERFDDMDADDDDDGVDNEGIHVVGIERPGEEISTFSPMAKQDGAAEEFEIIDAQIADDRDSHDGEEKGLEVDEVVASSNDANVEQSQGTNRGSNMPRESRFEIDDAYAKDDYDENEDKERQSSRRVSRRPTALTKMASQRGGQETVRWCRETIDYYYERRIQQRDDNKEIDHLRLMFDNYKLACPYWEGIIMTERIALTSLRSAFEDNGLFNLSAGLFMVLACISLQARYGKNMRNVCH